MGIWYSYWKLMMFTITKLKMKFLIWFVEHLKMVISNNTVHFLNLSLVVTLRTQNS